MATRITPDELRKIAPAVYEREFGAESREKPALDRKPDKTPNAPQNPRGSRERAAPSYTRPTLGEVFAFLALLVQAIVSAIVFTRW